MLKNNMWGSDNDWGNQCAT